MPLPVRLLICLLLLHPSTATAFECTVCHSKNPAMVRMHTSLRGQSCFDCHRIGDKLMGKGTAKDRNSQIKRRLTETVCQRCHQNDNQSVARETVHGSP